MAKRGRKRSQVWWAGFGVRAYVDEVSVHLVRYTRQGFPIAARSANVCGDTRWELFLAIELEVLKMLEKPVERRVIGENVVVPRDVKASKEWPLLWDHLTQTTWPDGSPRTTSSLLIFAADGVLKAMLRDREAGLCLWVASPSWGGLLTVLEASLGDPGAEWRLDRQLPGQQAKRTKRTS